MVDIKVTTVIDLELKTAFELAFSSNPKKYKEALDRGALDMLAETDPLKASELRVTRYMQLIKEEQEKQSQFKLIQQLSKKEVKKEAEEDKSIEKNRLLKYNDSKQSMANQVNNNSIDWKVIAAPNILNFKTPYETEIWTREQLFKDKLIGCANCRRWKEAEQYCPEKKGLTNANQTCRNWKVK